MYTSLQHLFRISKQAIYQASLIPHKRCIWHVYCNTRNVLDSTAQAWLRTVQWIEICSRYSSPLNIKICREGGIWEEITSLWPPTPISIHWIERCDAWVLWRAEYPVPEEVEAQFPSLPASLVTILTKLSFHPQKGNFYRECFVPMSMTYLQFHWTHNEGHKKRPLWEAYSFADTWEIPRYGPKSSFPWPRWCPTGPYMHSPVTCSVEGTPPLCFSYNLYMCSVKGWDQQLEESVNLYCWCRYSHNAEPQSLANCTQGNLHNRKLC
jgi:hypothetical protein